MVGAAVVAALATGAIALAGCGESTETVSVSSAPTSTGTQARTSAASGSTSTHSTTPTTATGATGATGPASGSATPSTTRTAPAPAFAEQERAKTTGAGGTSAEGAEGAAAVVREHGYLANNTSEYHPNQTLRVLIGTGERSNDGYDKRAFFFLDGRYIGTDASTPSAQVSVVSQGDTEVTLAYSLYRPHDALCCPSGGQAKVTFQLNNGKLAPLQPIPPAQSSTGLSRQ